MNVGVDNVVNAGKRQHPSGADSLELEDFVRLHDFDVDDWFVGHLVDVSGFEFKSEGVDLLLDVRDVRVEGVFQSKVQLVAEVSDNGWNSLGVGK